MPDIANRDKREQALETLLRRALGRTRQRLIDALGSPPDVANIPDALWEEVAIEVESDTRDTIALVLLLGMRRMSADFDWRPDSDLAGERAARYADRRASQLADGMVDTYRDRLTTAARDATATLEAEIAEAEAVGRDIEQAERAAQKRAQREVNRLAREIVAEQAASGGVTETTAANSSGEMEWRNLFEEETGVELRAIWNTEPGACEICYPLDGKGEEDWGDDFPNGPTAHVNCRCWLTFEPVEIEQLQEA